ncbi:GTP cyclohydrolase II [Nocardia sp. NBC_00565]|uniref:GTP cyclohydrolase II n=1 Tax=Nocardia sp. NBC_00565 TaxID=2975993 RepID=UPI002E80C8BF|nr:GTP cyclohydrolase II [Nocardia sp. NBC_00565]WUC06161.1 GTP cyclohydrolase II [Nocardia sp. NBC_00565]
MTTAPSNLDETGHRLTRKGRELEVRVLRIADDDDGGHALLFGDIADGCLVRIHSRCLYGDALRSDDCDCGPELDLAMDMIQQAGAGVLIYLEQEGRGAGLINKARGLRTSERNNIDTFESYRRLQLRPDSRSYTRAAEFLVAVGLSRVRLLTNNPDKVDALERVGLDVSVWPLHTMPRSERAREYLRAKRQRRGHDLPADHPVWLATDHPAPERKRDGPNRIGLLGIPATALPLLALGQVSAAAFSIASGLLVFWLCACQYDRSAARHVRQLRENRAMRRRSDASVEPASRRWRPDRPRTTTTVLATVEQPRRRVRVEASAPQPEDRALAHAGVDRRDG